MVAIVFLLPARPQLQTTRCAGGGSCDTAVNFFPPQLTMTYTVWGGGNGSLASTAPVIFSAGEEGRRLATLSSSPPHASALSPSPGFPDFTLISSHAGGLRMSIHPDHRSPALHFPWGMTQRRPASSQSGPACAWSLASPQGSPQFSRGHSGGGRR